MRPVHKRSVCQHGLHSTVCGQLQRMPVQMRGWVLFESARELRDVPDQCVSRGAVQAGVQPDQRWLVCVVHVLGAKQ